MKEKTKLFLGTATLAASLIALLCSCGGNSNSVSDAVTLNIVDSTEEVSSLDSYIEDMKAIRLDSKAQIVMSPNKLLIHGDELILLYAGKVSVYGNDGQFIRNIGRIGNGPGEYLHLQDCCISLDSKELLCLNHMNEVLRYSLSDGSYVGKTPTGIAGITASAIFPDADGGFYLFFANPSEADLANFEKEFLCLRRLSADGREIEAMLPRDDFNVNMGFASPSVQLADNGYVLSYRPGSGLAYEFSNGSETPFADISLGAKGIPAREAVKDGGNPWNMIGDIFMADYYKCPSSVCRTAGTYYCSAFGKDSSVWNFVLGSSSLRGIRWTSIGDGAQPMHAIAADKDYLYFCYAETGAESQDEVSDPLQKAIISRLGLVLGENDNPAIIKVKFKKL